MPKVKIILDQPRAIMGTAYKAGQVIIEGVCPIPVSEDKLKLALTTSRLKIEIEEDEPAPQEKEKKAANLLSRRKGKAVE